MIVSELIEKLQEADANNEVDIELPGGVELDVSGIHFYLYRVAIQTTTKHKTY